MGISKLPPPSWSVGAQVSRAWPHPLFLSRCLIGLPLHPAPARRHHRETVVARGSLGRGPHPRPRGRSRLPGARCCAAVSIFGYPFWMYRVHTVPLVTIAEGRIGYVYARDGQPLGPTQTLGRIVECNGFQDAGRVPRPTAASAVASARILREGVYAINTALFVVITEDGVHAGPVSRPEREQCRRLAAGTRSARRLLAGAHRLRVLRATRWRRCRRRRPMRATLVAARPHRHRHRARRPDARARRIHRAGSRRRRRRRGTITSRTPRRSSRSAVAAASNCRCSPTARSSSTAGSRPSSCSRRRSSRSATSASSSRYYGDERRGRHRRAVPLRRTGRSRAAAACGAKRSRPANTRSIRTR